MARDTTIEKIDLIWKQWDKTKDPKYKDLWYKLIKEFNQIEIDYQGGSAYRAMLKLFADNLKK